LQPTKLINERIGILAAVLSSTLGGFAAGITRFLVVGVDPIAIAVVRYSIGFLLLVPITIALRARWPRGRDWIWTACLGVLQFALFSVVFNVAFMFTTAAHGSLALSTMPLLTMLVAALLRAERLTARKTAGVLIAMAAVASVFVTGASGEPAGAWRGDLLMIAGTLCMAFYNVWSRPLIARSSALGFVTASMGIGTGCLLIVSFPAQGASIVADLDSSRWLAMMYLGVAGGAVAFYLWVFALEHTTPTRVATTITVNPLASSVLAALALGEPIGGNLIVGIIGVLAGIWLAMPANPTITE
jgi:drug/metabolite transporter (DMT)-like permease